MFLETVTLGLKEHSPRLRPASGKDCPWKRRKLSMYAFLCHLLLPGLTIWGFFIFHIYNQDTVEPLCLVPKLLNSNERPPATLSAAGVCLSGVCQGRAVSILGRQRVSPPGSASQAALLPSRTPPR